MSVLPVLWRLLAGGAAFGAAALVGLSFLGALHPAFDSLAHLRPHLAFVALLAGLFAFIAGPLPLRALGLAALAAGGIGLASVAAYVVPRGPLTANAGEPTRTLLQMNVLYSADIGPALALIRDLQPDLVTLQEVAGPMMPQLSALAGYALASCPGAERFAPVILSRHGFADAPGCERGPPLARRVELDGRPLTVISEHLSWPWPFPQQRAIAERIPRLATLPAPLIAGGDFNGTAWSVAMGRYAEASGAAPVAGIGLTFLDKRLPQALVPWIGLAIDNVLVSPGVRVVDARMLGPTGSDHRPVLVTFVLAPRADDARPPVAALGAPPEG